MVSELPVQPREKVDEGRRREVKVEIEVCGFKVRAETDFAPATSNGSADAEALKCASFIRLCNEARMIAKEYINAKLKGNGKDGVK